MAKTQGYFFLDTKQGILQLGSFLESSENVCVKDGLCIGSHLQKIDERHAKSIRLFYTFFWPFPKDNLCFKIHAKTVFMKIFFSHTILIFFILIGIYHKSKSLFSQKFPIFLKKWPRILIFSCLFFFMIALKMTVFFKPIDSSKSVSKKNLSMNLSGFNHIINGSFALKKIQNHDYDLYSDFIPTLSENILVDMIPINTNWIHSRGENGWYYAAIPYKSAYVMEGEDSRLHQLFAKKNCQNGVFIYMISYHQKILFLYRPDGLFGKSLQKKFLFFPHFETQTCDKLLSILSQESVVHGKH